MSGTGLAEELGNFSGLVRGLSDPRKGSKILTFLFRSRLVCKLAPTSPKLVEGAFCKLLRLDVLRSSPKLVKILHLSDC
jgi:hypothetical protein